MTAATRKAAERQRKQAAGLVRVEVWVPAEDADTVRWMAEGLRETSGTRDDLTVIYERGGTPRGLVVCAFVQCV